MADAIVFTQDELLAALNNGAADILLCDNSFRLPRNRDITYTAIGSVTAYFDFGDAADFNITCAGFTPKKRRKTVHISNKAVGTASLRRGSSFSSFASSYRLGSYGGSYSSSYRLWSGYKTSFRYQASYGGSYSSSYRLWSGYKTSFRRQASYSGSYSSSYRLWSGYKTSFRYQASYGGSYTSSYRLTSSYKSSFSRSFTLSSFIQGFKRKIYTRVLKEISVNGYGIHLI